jgi:hypothetical protein
MILSQSPISYWFQMKLLLRKRFISLDYKWKSNIIITVDLQINEFERILRKKLDMKIYSFVILN